MGKFQSGPSGNPSGRPKGALNKATLASQALLEGEAGGAIFHFHISPLWANLVIIREILP